MSFIIRIVNAVKIAWWAYMNPNSLTDKHFEMLSDLFAIIIKVGIEHRPMMCHVAIIHPDEGEKQIVSIWAGAGIGAEPIKRIEELTTENIKLREEIARLIRENQGKAFSVKTDIKDDFLNSPLHDKSAIIALMDKLNPAQMTEVVEFLMKNYANDKNLK